MLMGVLLVPDTVMRKCVSIPKMSYILKTKNTSSFRVLMNYIKVKHYLINISIIILICLHNSLYLKIMFLTRLMHINLI